MIEQRLHNINTNNININIIGFDVRVGSFFETINVH